MPREHVESRWQPLPFLVEGSEPIEMTAPPRFRVEVGWGRDQEFVQVTTKDPTEDDFPVVDGEVTTGRNLYVDLDRKGINDLIKILRRARDQAFGRDE